MNYLEINIKNPITNKEVDILIRKLLEDRNHEFVIIDFGDHEFESISTLK